MPKTSEAATHLEKVDCRGINVIDWGQVNNYEVECRALLLGSFLRSPLVLRQRIFHWIDICEIQWRVYAQQQQPIHLLRLRILLHIPAHHQKLNQSSSQEEEL